MEEGKDGTVWTVIHPAEHPGKQQSHHDLKEGGGPTAYAKENVKDALTAFTCVFDSSMLEHIRECTVAEAHRRRGDSSWDLTVAELKAFIALLYIRGALGAKSLELDSLWSEKWGFSFFKETIQRNRFKDIMRFLCFDRRETRHVGLQDDRFALISATWNKFVKNCVACYSPGANITIDQQLFPTKARCKFMANKPSKFGIKFWLAADAQSKYMLNGAPYLGKDKTRSRDQSVGEAVVLKLAEPFLGRGRNITADSFFTSLKLAAALQAKGTGIVGTVESSKSEMPPSAKEQAELFSTKLLKSGDATLTIYQDKPKTNVCILSTVHTTVGISYGPKAKPDSVTYYDSTKYSVDLLGQMARAYSVSSPTRRWPVAVFYNILDLAGINAHVLFKECTGSNTDRRRFLQQLAEELRAEFMSEKRSQTSLRQPRLTSKRSHCKVQKHCSRNKTVNTCCECRRPVCGKCTRKTLKIVKCVACDTFGQ